MKIAITATGADLQAQVDPRFGRAHYFIIVDPETMQSEAIENTSMSAAHGAGIQAGQLMSSKGVTVVITGNVGPNAYQTLVAAGIQIFQTSGGKVVEAIEAYKNKKLQPIQQSGPAHAGKI
jgi:predicted Fe-Mo cluster-binding NifX family protein